MKTLPREYHPSCAHETYHESNLRHIENAFNKKKAKSAQAHFEFASLHRPGNQAGRKGFGGHSNENKYSVQMYAGMQGGMANFAPNLDHIYESIDSDSMASTLYEQHRRLNMQNFYGANYRSKSTVNDDDLSSSSIYEDKPLLIANHNCTLAYENNRSKRMFIPQHYHSNASIYDKTPKEKQCMPPMETQPGGASFHGQTPTGAMWQFDKEAHELPDLLQKSAAQTNNLLVSYSGENRFLNKVVNQHGKPPPSK